MIATLSLFGIEKAPLNSDVVLVGLHSLMGIGKAYLSLVSLVNLCVLRLLCAIVAKEQTEFREVFCVFIIAMPSEMLISELTSRFMGVFSIVPIFFVTMLLLMRFCGIVLTKAAAISGLYYVYQAISIILVRMVWLKV